MAVEPSWVGNCTAERGELLRAVYNNLMGDDLTALGDIMQRIDATIGALADTATQGQQNAAGGTT